MYTKKNNIACIEEKQRAVWSNRQSQNKQTCKNEPITIRRKFVQQAIIMSARKLYFFSNQSQEIAVVLMIGWEQGTSSSLIQVGCEITLVVGNSVLV